jgi:hypothetical protein
MTDASPVAADIAHDTNVTRNADHRWGLSVAMRKSPLVARSESPVLVR